MMRDGRAPNLSRWAAGVDATCRRAALLISGDLESAVADASSGPQLTTTDTRDQRVADLLIQSVSPEHSAMRRQLGIAIS